ncbi:MAG: rhodanese-like domain-containing protein [Alphaproteobacteria bacterium]
MFLDTILSEGLAHRAYLLGDGAAAAAIDPARDVDRYLAAADARGARIGLIFETHRNEDYVSGARELAARTGATVWRGTSPDYAVAYARTVTPGQRFALGGLCLRVLATPGHTDDSISIAYAPGDGAKDALGVFTGDALFAGDVGRTDFYPDRRAAVAGLLFDSLHDVLLPLGDQAVIHPAHGAGSVCGSRIAAREATTIGYERRHNPRLGLDRDAFIAAKVAEHHYQPPYFRQMERANQGEGMALAALPPCRPLDLAAARAACADGAQLLDLRRDEAIAGAGIAAAIAIPIDMLAAFGGWFLDPDRPIVLLLDRVDERERAVRLLVRMGYDRIAGFLADGFQAWSAAAEPVAALPGMDVHALRHRISSNAPPHLLDVRAREELSEGRIGGAQHVYVGEIERRLDEIPDGPVVTYCATGRRALVAAAALRRLGRSDVAVCWGSMAAWQVAGYPLEGAGAAAA